VDPHLIFDFAKKKPYNKYGAKNSQDCRGDNIGQIMRGDVHAGKADEQRDRKTSQTDPPIRKKQNSEKRRGRGNVTRWKRVKF